MRAALWSLCLLLGLVLRPDAVQAVESQRTAPEAGAAKAASAGGQPGQEKTLRLKRFSCVDRQGTGIEAFSMLIPADWQFEGGIRWVLDNPSMPATAAFTVRSPGGSDVFEVFPNQAFYWTDNQMMLSNLPPGGRYFGNEVRPPVGALEALKQIVVPRFRGKAAGLRIVGEQLLPELAKALGAGAPQPGVSTSASAAKVRLEYAEGGRWMEEEVYGVVETVSFQTRTMTGVHTNTMWYADYLFSFRSEMGKLASRAKLFQTMASSFRINPQWFSKYNQLVEYLIQRQIQHIQNIGQLSRMISQTHDQISREMMDSYNQRQAVYDRLSDDFSRHIRGVEQYHDPLQGKSVELPAGYPNVWANSNGEYVLTEDPNFNPAVGSNLHWERIEPAGATPP